jgi:hypothetical protein
LMQYFEVGIVKGEFSIKQAVVTKIPSSDPISEGRENVFQIETKEGEVVLISAETQEGADDWIQHINIVASGRWKLHQRLCILAKLLGITSPPLIKIEIDATELMNRLLSAGYDSDRFSEVFFEAYFDKLISKVKCFMKSDPTFAQRFVTAFHSRTIRLQPADPPLSSSYFRTSFNANGDLIIEFKEVFTNIHQLGSDLARSLPVDLSTTEQPDPFSSQIDGTDVLVDVMKGEMISDC